MKRFFSCRKIAIAAFCGFAFIVLQVVLMLHAASARTCAFEYLGREVLSESSGATDFDYYGEGEDRWNLKVPPFKYVFRMHTATFEWNDNGYIPPEAGIAHRDVWVGTCTLTPKAPWRYIDLFGHLGPFECSVYGDWHVESGSNRLN